MAFQHALIMKNLQTSLFYVLATVLLFSSCCLGDKVAEYDYRITNNSETAITVEVDANELQANTFETQFTIEVGATQSVLMTTGAIVSACEDLEYSDEKIETDLEGLAVMNQDSITSSRNYLDGDEWNFNEGVYTITVEQSEF